MAGDGILSARLSHTSFPRRSSGREPRLLDATSWAVQTRGTPNEVASGLRTRLSCRPAQRVCAAASLCASDTRAQPHTSVLTLLCICSRASRAPAPSIALGPHRAARRPRSPLARPGPDLQLSPSPSRRDRRAALRTRDHSYSSP